MSHFIAIPDKTDVRLGYRTEPYYFSPVYVSGNSGKNAPQIVKYKAHEISKTFKIRVKLPQVQNLNFN